MFYEVIPLKLFRQDAGVLTYSSGQPLLPGHLVKIPLGRSETTGIVKARVKSVDFQTKPISALLYDTPLPPHLLKSLLWLSAYYLTPLPTVASLFLPSNLTNARLPKDFGGQGFASQFAPARTEEKSATKIPLNAAQQTALKDLKGLKTPTRLLHGITGSGKTNIYLTLTSETLTRGQSTILLVPEIALTSQLVQSFRQTFKNQHITLIHSRQTPKERRETWAKLLHSQQPEIIIGPRSALFSPVKNLGLIIIDESHESAYYQENSPKYSALRLASFIAKTLNIPCIQGSATPLVSDLHLAKAHHSYVELKEKAKLATPPKIHLIDLKDRANFTTNKYFSDQLYKKIKANLANHHQTLIFHNRRGSAPLTLCEHCGWQALCPTCFLPLTLHSDHFHLLCHTCGHQQDVPLSCPDCHHPDIIHKGFGTKLLEHELKKLFKDTNIARFDADNKKSETLSANYADVKSGKVQIILGTQTLAKGLDLPHLATVGVVQADSGLSLPDFSSEERTFHLLTQVIGRVGRGHIQDTDVFLQTFYPDHPIISSAIKNDYHAFANHLLKTRQKAHFPPYYYLAKLSLTYKTEKTTLKHIKSYHQALKTIGNLEVSLPTPAFHERTPKGFTWQLILKAKSRQTLLSALNSLPTNNHLHLSLDPPSLI